MSTHAIIEFGVGIAVYKHFDGYPHCILPALLKVFDRNGLAAWNGGLHAAAFIQDVGTSDLEILAEHNRDHWPDITWHYEVCYAHGQIEVSGDGRTFVVDFGTDVTLLSLAALQV